MILKIKITGVTEDQFGETWARGGTANIGDDSVLIAKSRM